MIIFKPDIKCARLKQKKKKHNNNFYKQHISEAKIIIHANMNSSTLSLNFDYHIIENHMS